MVVVSHITMPPLNNWMFFDASPVYRQKPRGLVNLFEMLEFYAADFWKASHVIGQITAMVDAGGRPSEVAWLILRQDLRTFEQCCKDMGLPVTLDQVRRALRLASQPGTPSTELASCLVELTSRFVDEVKGLQIWALTPSSVEYSNQEQFGPAVCQRFPNLADDIAEAARCLLFERYTACVFHLMRVLELGLREVAQLAGLENIDRQNWGTLINSIESRLRKLEADHDWKALPNWRERRDALAECVVQFSAFRDAWRNHVAHARCSYSETEARRAFVAVRAFMERLALIDSPE
jgi:hypothetical protein